MPIPRSTQQWLQPLFQMLEGKGNRPLMLGSPTQVMGFYGTTGLPRIATGSLRSTGGSTAGASGAPDTSLYNGGTGTYVSTNDIVRALKNAGFLPL